MRPKTFFDVQVFACETRNAPATRRARDARFCIQMKFTCKTAARNSHISDREGFAWVLLGSVKPRRAQDTKRRQLANVGWNRARQLIGVQPSAFKNATQTNTMNQRPFLI